MKFRWDNRYLHWGVTAFLVIAASMLFYYGIFHMKTLIVGIKTFLDYHLRITDDGASSVDPKYHEYYLQFSVLYKSY